MIHSGQNISDALTLEEEATGRLAELRQRYFLLATDDEYSDRLHSHAREIVVYAAHLVASDGPKGNWEAVYDTWLQRATQHAVQAGALGRST